MARVTKAPQQPSKLIDTDYESPELILRYRAKYMTAFPGSTQESEWTREAIKWYSGRIRKDIKLNQQLLLRNQEYKKKKGTEKTLLGKLFFYEYEAEEAGNADTGLYDRYPMVFFFNSTMTKEGKQVLWGLNIHYLPPLPRALFFIQLLKYKSTKGANARTKLRLQWSLIKALSEKDAKLCVHAYRVDRLKSRLVEIDPRDWPIAVNLRLEKWVSPKGEQVHATFGRQKMTQLYRPKKARRAR